MRCGSIFSEEGNILIVKPGRGEVLCCRGGQTESKTTRYRKANREQTGNKMAPINDRVKIIYIEATKLCGGRGGGLPSGGIKTSG